MSIQVSYMGTKRTIAASVAKVISDAPPGPLLDLFSGICAVASEVAPCRQIWCNDIQRFAATVAEVFFTLPTRPYSDIHSAELTVAPFSLNNSALVHRFTTLLQAEHEALNSTDINQLQSLERLLPTVATCNSLESERALLAVEPTTFPYRLFTITFSGGYLGLQQSIHIDSIRYALDFLLSTGQLNLHQHKWMSIALCQATSKVATTTGHFAQYMRVKENTWERFISQRRRSIWTEWLKAIYTLSPIGTRQWRINNRVFSKDANVLLKDLYKRSDPPAVIYADPPYTSDQYSRYYHLYETLLLYDYPTAAGVGRYRPDRYRSHYSLITRAQEALTSLVSDSAQLGAKLVLSYPEKAIIPNSKAFITSLLKRYFGDSYNVLELDHFHSSLGASKGYQKYRVKELIFSAG